MSYRYDIYSKYCEDGHEYETGFDDEEDAQSACEERISEIIDDNELDPEEESDFDWEVTEDEDFEDDSIDEDD